MKKLTLHLLSIIAVCSMLVSCLKNDPVTSTTITGYFTIDGTYPNYTLYRDGGGIIYPTPQSVADVTSGKGLGNIHRAQIAINYDFDQVTEPQPGQKGEVIVKNARIVGLVPIDEQNILTNETAQEKNILATDSLFDVITVYQPWYSRFYLTLPVNAYYSVNTSLQKAITPTVNLVCHSDSISTNRVALNVCYNQHSKKDESSKYYKENFLTSYNISNLLRQTPGNDTVNVVLHATVNSKRQSVVVKCPRPSYSDYYN